MFPRISKNSKRIVAALTENRKPNQIAWGIAFGAILGLIPYENLVVVGIVLTIALMRINQLAACVTALGLWGLQGFFGPVCQALGEWILQQSMIAEGMHTIYRYPLLPWTCLDQPAVSGGIALGVLIFLPTYFICNLVCVRAKHRLELLALDHVANDAIHYRKAVLDQSSSRRESVAPVLRIAEPLDGDSEKQALISDAPSADRSENKSPSKSKKSNGTTRHSAVNTGDSRPSIPAPTPLSIVSISSDEEHKSNADSLEAIHGGRLPSSSRFKTMPTITHGDTSTTNHDTVLRETVIEVVRYRLPAKHTSDNPKKVENTPNSLALGIPMTVVNAMHSKSVETKRDADFNKSKPLGEPTISIDPGHAIASGAKDESLRYLIWHINGTRDSSRKGSEKTA